MNIYQKLIEVRKLVEFLVKDEQGYQYKYVSGSSLLNTIRPKMDELGLMLITDIVSAKHERFTWEGVDNKGNPKTFFQFVVNFEIKFIWVNAENPEEKFTYTWFGSGEDEDPAKAEGKAFTYSERYSLLKFFKVATDNEDPDAVQKPRITPQRDISKEQTSTMLSTVYATADKVFKARDEFKAWRVDGDMPENIEKLSDLALAQIWNKLKAIKK